MTLLAGDIDTALRKKVDDEDTDNPLFQKATRYNAISKAAVKVAAIIDEADEGYRVESLDFASVLNQIDYALPTNCEKVKQVVPLDSDGNELDPPRGYIPWVHRNKIAGNNPLDIVNADTLRGGWYSIHGEFLALLPKPTQSASYKDSRLYWLPAMPTVPSGDTNYAIPLPKFAANLLVALAALELRGPTGEDASDLATDIVLETATVTRRVANRSDDGPSRLIDGNGPLSFASGY